MCTVVPSAPDEVRKAKQNLGWPEEPTFYIPDEGVATCEGFGPRFLHSTGRAYKGGPNSGVFLQLTCDDRQDLEIRC